MKTCKCCNKTFCNMTELKAECHYDGREWPFDWYTHNTCHGTMVVRY